MKKIVTLLLNLLFVLQGMAQDRDGRAVSPAITTRSVFPKDSLLTRLSNSADRFLQLYKCGDASKNNQKHSFQAGLPGVADAAFAPVFTTVLLNSDNTINVGNAGAVVQDNNVGMLSANYAYQRKGQRYFQLFNAGILTETNGNVWELYSANSWRSGILGTVGLTHTGGVKGRYADPADCEKGFQKHRLFLNSLLAQYRAKLETEAQRNLRIKALERQLGADQNSSLVMAADPLNGIANDPKQTDRLQQELDSLKNVQQELIQLSGQYAGTTGYDRVLQDELAAFDRKNMPAFSGYRTWWYSVKASVGNTRNKLYNDSLTNDHLRTYHVSDYLRLKLSWDINRVWNTKTGLWFLKGEALLYNRNFLQNKEMSEFRYLEKDATGKKYVYTPENAIHYGRLGSLENLNTSIWVFAPGIYGATFFALDKCVGVEASAGYKFNLNRLQDVPDPNTYTIYGGLIFRVKKDETLSKATISLNIGFFEAKKDRRAPDNFAFRLKVGVPFNMLPKKA